MTSDQRASVRAVRDQTLDCSGASSLNVSPVGSLARSAERGQETLSYSDLPVSAAQETLKHSVKLWSVEQL